MLPHNIFFEPNKTFLDWLQEPFLRYRRIVDCGAGVGRLGAVAKNDVLGIDVIPRDSYESIVHTMDSTRFEFEPTDVCIICRPCHSPFVMQTFERALRCGVEDMFYVGLDRNLEKDIDTDEWFVERILEDVGVEGEHVYRLYGPRHKLKNFIKVPSMYDGEPRWAHMTPRNGEIWATNAAGGGYPIKPSDILETFTALNQNQFDRPHPSQFASASQRSAEAMWRDAGNYEKERGGYGWVGPDGAWWPCGSRDHDTLIYDCFGIDSRREAELGFVKCYGRFWNKSTLDWKDISAPNRDQMDTLQRIGFRARDREHVRTVDTLSPEEREKL